ncbi:MAG: hypothetical protein OEW09_08630 [Anaerolineae bacterium]|nr:hypothetical protein [Anaerolineae bacterium]
MTEPTGSISYSHKAQEWKDLLVTHRVWAGGSGRAIGVIGGVGKE